MAVGAVQLGLNHVDALGARRPLRSHSPVPVGKRLDVLPVPHFVLDIVVDAAGPPSNTRFQLLIGYE